MWPEMVPFGAVSAPDQYRSLNGLGVHQRMWESAGAKVLTPQKLSPRLETFDTIVLVGQTFNPPGKAAREWLEDWLGRKSGRSVIYFGRDFNANIYYRQQTLAQLDKADQARGEDLLALARAREFSQKLQEVPESTFCEWFFLDVEQAPQKLQQFRGKWKQKLGDAGGEWPTSVLLRPPKLADKQRKPSWLKNKPANALQPASSFTPAGGSSSLRSQWYVSEFDTDEAWDEAFEDLPQTEMLLAGNNSEPLVFRLTHPQRYPDSQLIVVANGAPLLNGSLIQPLHRRVGELLIEQCLPSERVALLAYSPAGMLISSAPEADARSKGLEMLTVWPLSGITVPALLFGLIVCAMLLPILGRPQQLSKRSTSDFGLHVAALGDLLYRSGDIDYAKKTISEYFEKVRGEPPPFWLEAIDRRGEFPPQVPQDKSAPTAAELTTEDPASSSHPASKQTPEPPIANKPPAGASANAEQ